VGAVAGMATAAVGLLWPPLLWVLWLLWPPLLEPLASAMDGTIRAANSNALTISAKDFITGIFLGRRSSQPFRAEMRIILVMFRLLPVEAAGASAEAGRQVMPPASNPQSRFILRP
jgi:hypothetical protein